MFINYLYSKKKSNFFTIFKQIRELLFALRNNNFLRKNGTVWVTPYFPSRNSTLYKISRNLGFNLVSRPFSNTTLGINFHDSTFQSERITYPFNFTIINKNIFDISKSRVDFIHQQVFGYNTIIDPKKYIGRCVVKSNENALHDGTPVQCPVIEIDPRKIYQVLIDNQEADLFVDFRVCVMKSEIVIIYKKFKELFFRFTNETCKAEIIHHELIPEDIRAKIIQFCEIIEAEFCELDVLKDNNSNKWYVIDVNKTPYGPPASLSNKDKKKAVRILSDGFRKNFLEI